MISLIKKIIIVLLIISCIIIIVNLVIKKRDIQKSITYKEGMLSESAELGSLEIHNNSISVANVVNKSLKLSQYCIKSSYNSV